MNAITILLISLALIPLTFSAHSGTIVLNYQCTVENEDPPNSQDTKDGSIRVKVEKIITDYSSYATVFVSSNVSIYALHEATGFVGLAQIRGSANLDISGNYRNVADNGIPDWISKSIVDAAHKRNRDITSVVRRPPKSRSHHKVFYSGTKSHGIKLSPPRYVSLFGRKVQVTPNNTRSLQFDETAQYRKDITSSPGNNASRSSAIIAMFKAYAEARGEALNNAGRSIDNHVPSISHNTDMPCPGDDDDDDSAGATGTTNDVLYVDATTTAIFCQNCDEVVSSASEHWVVCKQDREANQTPSVSGGLTYTHGCGGSFWTCYMSDAEKAKHKQYTVCPAAGCNVRKRNCDSRFACAGLPHTTVSNNGDSSGGSSGNSNGGIGSTNSSGDTVVGSRGLTRCSSCGRNYREGMPSYYHHAVLTCGRTYNGVTCGVLFRHCNNPRGSCSVYPGRPKHGNGS